MNIKSIALILALLLCITTGSLTGIAQTDTSSLKPEMLLLPNEVHLDYVGKEFLTSSVKVLNKGAVPLIINHLKPSCLCVSGVVERSTIPPLGIGKIRLNINTTAITDSFSRVDLYIYTNQNTGAISLPIYLSKKKVLVVDSLKKTD